MNLRESINQPLYDTAAAAAGATTFFTIPIGQGNTLFGSGPKHYGDTNMYLAAQLPAGWMFQVRAIMVEPIGATASALVGAVIELVLGAKTFLTLPTSRATVSLVVTGAGAIALDRAVDMIRDVDPAGRAMLLGSVPGVSIGFNLEANGLVLHPTHNFCARLVLPDCAPESTIVRIYLNGQMGRPVQ